MAKVSFKRVESINDLNSIDIEDGNFIITGDSNAFIDYGSKRIPIGGTPDNQMDDSSTNSVQNKIIKKYIDDKTSTNSKNIEELKESKIYSTEEKVIGKWIDGKPVYRKVIDSICGNLYTLLNELNIDFLIDIKGNAWSNYDQKMPINAPNPEPPNYVFGVYQTASNSNIEVFYNSNYFANQNKIICTVIYTKTTDEVVE